VNPKRELVVFLPAVGGDHSFWEPQAQALAPDYAVLAPDLVRAADQVSMAGFADDVAALIEKSGYAQAHVVGLSMGGVVALELFKQHRSHVRSLTLANTWAFQSEGEARIRFAEDGLAAGLPSFSRSSMPGLFAPSTQRGVVEHCVAVESAKDPAMYLQCWREMFRVDLRLTLDEIDVPVLLVGGALDPVTPTSLLVDIRSRVPTARLVELPAASHFSNLDCPQQFNELLRSHLRSARSSGDDRRGSPKLEEISLPEQSAAERLLELLRLRGVECLFSNSGTDFTPIIDALAHLAERDRPTPRVVQVPHENTVVAMAHGHALLSGRPQAAMVHVNVGTANIGMGLINARRAHVPLLAIAGRTPHYEEGKVGVRTNFVQWGQDTFDQGAMFREFTKWDYELRSPHALETVVDRALAISQSAPAGPCYLVLPKEPLCEKAPASHVSVEPRLAPSRAAAPDEQSLRTALNWIRSAKRPLIVTADLGRHPGGPEALVRFSLAIGAGVVEHGKRNFFNFPTEHPHHLGFEPNALVAEADLVIAVECPVPWIPAQAKLKRAPPVIQIALDPLFSDLPMRGFPSDLSLAGDVVLTLRALERTLGPNPVLARLAERHEQTFGSAREAAQRQGEGAKITKTFLSRAIGKVVDDEVSIFNEYDLDPIQVPRRTPDSWFENSCASGLGWALGAALGAKLAAPERTMLVTVGDGTYLFNTPLSAHYVASAEKLPVLIVVFNDSAWSTIKRSTRGSHPDGWSVRTRNFPLCDFVQSIDFEKVVEACGGIGMRIEAPDKLEGSLHEALRLVRSGDRHVLVNVVCERDG
jgi:acetolactate synthase-1/2/3 large subunit